MFHAQTAVEASMVLRGQLDRRGLSSDATHMYLETGNGDFNAAVGNFSDSFLSVTPDSSTAVVAGQPAPTRCDFVA